ncbi:hypothetical protein EON83_23985 [bacterium]|nr:MAG: hypothetical protein EON83_23985 [bacterium]
MRSSHMGKWLKIQARWSPQVCPTPLALISVGGFMVRVEVYRQNFTCVALDPYRVFAAIGRKNPHINEHTPGFTSYIHFSDVANFGAAGRIDGPN